MHRLIKQLAFINSHKVRKPVVTCLGLIDLINSNDTCSLEEIKLILHYLKVTMTDLDEETRNMAVLLNNQREQADRTFESSFYLGIKNPDT